MDTIVDKTVEPTTVASDSEWAATNSVCTQIGRLTIELANPTDEREVLKSVNPQECGEFDNIRTHSESTP